jgi:hypothetical protein
MDVGPSPVVLNHRRIGHRPSGNDDGHIQYCLIIDVVADIDAVILANVIFIVIVVEQRRVRRLAFALGDVLWRPVVNGSREGAMLPPTMLPRQRWRLPGL